MTYEKRYKEALEEAKKLYGKHCIDNVLENIFPELKEKESEDERMSKEIIDFLRLPHHQFAGKRYHEKWIAWLEKQGEEKYALKSFRDKDVHKFMQYIEKQAKAYEFNLPNRSYDIYAFAKDILIWLENQGELKTKPKFKVRDWIVDDFGNYWRVVKVRPNYYEIEGDDGVGSIPTRKWVDEKYHLWTIDDAKKGDILVVDGISIVEFDKHMTDGCPWKKNSILTSVEYDMDDDICTTGSHIFYDDIWPASKEDIDLLKKKRNDYLASNSHNESKFKVGDKV